MIVDERLERVESLLNRLLNDGLPRFIADNNPSACNGDDDARTANSSQGRDLSDPQEGYSLWTWKGKIRPMPPDYKYPKKTSLKNIHDLWYQGVPALKIRPFKFIKGIL